MRATEASGPVRERAVVAAVQRPEDRDWQVRDAMEEMALLAASAGVEVADRFWCRLRRPTAPLLLGRGQAGELAARVAAADAGLILFDEDLSPVQARNLEDATGVRVLDRTQVILDIFAQRARSREGRLQVELAQLEYARPRLRTLWTHFERQKGGIGLRGPGEQQLELDRRRIGRRIDTLREGLERVRARRAELRRGRARHGWAQICLVGYTNAGKSTLLNALTSGEALADDKLFATLDPTTRRVDLPPARAALLTDTVGFIRKLPHRLVDAFRATLEEVGEADLLLHVVDASNPQVEAQGEAVEATLRELGAGDTPVVTALNKADRPEGRARAEAMQSRLRRCAVISARTGDGLDALRLELADALKEAARTVPLRIPMSEGRILAWLRREGRILSARYEGDGARIRARIPLAHWTRVAPFLDEAPEAPGPDPAEPGGTPGSGPAADGEPGPRGGE